MRHLCRDFLTATSASCPGTNMYALSIFLLHVGGFEVIGQTNFDILTSSIQLGLGTSGTINNGLGTNVVKLPASSYAVSSADIGRILVLKSPMFPRSNSGLFRITAADTNNNALTIDYRSPSSPPSETLLSWRVFESETAFASTWQSGSNGLANYSSWTINPVITASCSRIVLQSPDASHWQVRMCLEALADVSGAVPSGFSVAPGFGGTPDGDLLALPPISGPPRDRRYHLHGAQWYNTTSSLYRGMTVGLSPCLVASGSSLWTKGQWRISAMVDDVSGTCAIVNRNVSLPTPNSGSGWCVFGLTEDEEDAAWVTNPNDPVVNIQRLFVIGSSNPQSNLTLTSQFHIDNNTQVVGWSKYGYPIAGVLSCYSDISNPNNSHVRYLTSSSDAVWDSKTELLDVDVLLGTVDVTLVASSSQSLWPMQPRRLGRLPMFMQGRANYANWSVSGDEAWYHTQDGIFMQWGGPATADAQGSSVIASSGSVNDAQGLVAFGAFLPGSDPPVPVLSPNISDIDATRFRKTYSYFRQVPIIVGVIRGGSNPSR